MNYDELDAIYEKHPEIKELVRASAKMLSVYWSTPVSVTSNKKLRDASIDLMRAGPRVDNRNWLK